MSPVLFGSIAATNSVLRTRPNSLRLLQIELTILRDQIPFAVEESAIAQHGFGDSDPGFLLLCPCRWILMLDFNLFFQFVKHNGKKLAPIDSLFVAHKVPLVSLESLPIPMVQSPLNSCKRLRSRLWVRNALKTVLGLL